MFVSFIVLHRLNQAHQSSYDLFSILLFYWWRAQAIIPILAWHPKIVKAILIYNRRQLKLGINRYRLSGSRIIWSWSFWILILYNLSNLRFYFENFYFIYIFITRLLKSLGWAKINTWHSNSFANPEPSIQILCTV